MAAITLPLTWDGSVAAHSVMLFMHALPTLQEVYVVEVEVYAGEGMLPATTELYLSVDGTTFTQIASLDLPLSKRKEVAVLEDTRLYVSDMNHLI